jgi:hypothetical protein
MTISADCCFSLPVHYWVFEVGQSSRGYIHSTIIDVVLFVVLLIRAINVSAK